MTNKKDKKDERSTRSRSRTKTAPREPRTTSSDTTHSNLTHAPAVPPSETALSQDEVEGLPVNKVNTSMNNTESSGEDDRDITIPNKSVNNDSNIPLGEREQVTGENSSNEQERSVRSLMQGDDNRESQHIIPKSGEGGTLCSSSKPGDPWYETFQELKAIRHDTFQELQAMRHDTSHELKAIRERMTQMESSEEPRLAQLGRIEESTSSFKNQIAAVVNRTTEIENKVENNNSKVQELCQEISTLKQIVQNQEDKITALTNLKEEISKDSKETVAEMNTLIQQQKDQVGSFNDTTKRFKREIHKEVDQKLNTFSQNLDHKSLKDQAFRNRHNLVVTGLAEDPSKNTQTLVSEHFVNTLKIPKVDIKAAQRIGPEPTEGSSYCRPILVKFPIITHRNLVWKKRMDITAEDGETKIRIQADLPKRLREDVRLLYRVLRAAESVPEYKTAFVSDYSIALDGKTYSPRELELLPLPLRPSTLATRASDQVLTFFSRHTFLSNHHHSEFKIQGNKFHNVEQYLAFRRASLSGKKSTIQKALRSKNPVEAKAILNSLKEDHTEEWNDKISEWAEEGIRAKFQQNPTLADALCNTGTIQLGEASRNEKWGIGMDLENPDVTDPSKWLATGNLLGKTLMTIRQELRAGKEAATHGENL